MHAPISILNNSDWSSCDVVTGSGTSNDPYIIANVTIDASGSTGISIHHSNVTAIIQNCTIINAYNGIYLYYSSNCSIQDLFIQNCTNSAIVIEHSNNCTCTNNFMEFNKYAILIYTSTKCKMLNNTIVNNNDSGIYANYCSDCTFQGNSISDGKTFGIVISNSNNCDIIENVILNNKEHGIWIFSSSYCSISNNTCKDNLRSEIFIDNSPNCLILRNFFLNHSNSSSEDVINIYLSENCSLIKNEIFNTKEVGIGVYSSNNSIVIDNRINTSFDGICIVLSYNSSIYNNTIKYCLNNGIKINTSPESSISKNNVSSSSNGISIYYSTNSVISENIVYNNSNNGMSLTSTNCIIRNNTINQNLKIGLYLWNTYNCYFSENNIISNYQDGISLGYSNSCIFENNIISNNSNNGLKLSDGAYNNSILRNNISFNLEYGVELLFGSNFNRMEENWFVMNQQDAFLDNGYNNTIDNNYIIGCLKAFISASKYSAITGEEISFSAYSEGGLPPYVYYWEFGDGFTSNDMDPLHTYSDPGIYTVILTITDSDGFSSSTSISITVDSDLLPMAAFSYSASTVAVGEVIYFTDKTTGGNPPYTYFWDFGDGTTSTEQNVSHSYSSEGEYCVFLLVMDSDGDYSNTSTWISVSGGEDYEPYASIGASKTYVIPAEIIWFWCDFGGGDPPLSYYWDFGDGITSEESNPKHSYSYVGVYTVEFAVTDNDGDTAYAYISITVHEDSQPIVAFSVSSSVVTVGTDVFFYDRTTGGDYPLDYRWNFGDGSFANEQNAIHTYINPGIYTVFLFVTDSDGDAGSFSLEITVVESPNSNTNDSDSSSNSIDNPFNDLDWSSIPGYPVENIIFSMIGTIAVVSVVNVIKNKRK
ncbi:MAG: right-handed parallel beta-helix repeat-containing protein [Candidatus Lokiarchaeota archaeon]|nr:right-handed parallel beta-helix repeat-containing protein [Candidatus Harpocratesius repetitus]